VESQNRRAHIFRIFRWVSRTVVITNKCHRRDSNQRPCEYEICQCIALTTGLAGTSMSVFKYNTVWQCELAGRMLDFSADMPNTFLYRSREYRGSLSETCVYRAERLSQCRLCCIDPRTSEKLPCELTGNGRSRFPFPTPTLSSLLSVDARSSFQISRA
jgi:hypothetical protein